MTLLFFDGFESGNTTSRPEWVVGSLSVNSSVPRTGSYHMTSSTAATTGNNLLLPGGAVTQVIVGLAWYNATSVSLPVVYVYGDANTTQHLTVMHNSGGSGAIELRRGGTGGTVLATSTQTYPINQWRHMQVKATINATTGMCQVKIDGVTVIDYTGNTKNGGTNNSIDGLRFGGTNNNMHFDDLWVCDSVDATASQGRANNDWLGDLKISALLPTAAGDLTQFTPSTGANWSCVDEPVINTTDYVTSTAAGQRDLYQLADLPAGSANVYGVRVSTWSQKTDAGLMGVTHLVKENGVVTGDAAPRALSTTFGGTSSTTWWRRPSDNALWTPTDINALQAGQEATAM